MRASINFELENPEDFAAFAKFFGKVSAAPASSVEVDPSRWPEPIRQPAPEPERQIAKPDTAPADEKAAEPEKVEQDEGVEEVTKELVAKELRKFMADAGAEGPRKALGILKNQFGVAKFDDLPAEQYSKLLSALKQ
jgi:hypothetical protein